MFAGTIIMENSMMSSQKLKLIYQINLIVQLLAMYIAKGIDVSILKRYFHTSDHYSGQLQEPREWKEPTWQSMGILIDKDVDQKLVLDSRKQKMILFAIA